MMYGNEKSGSAIVAGKPTNKAERSAAELVERRAETKGNAGQQRTRRAQYWISMSKMLARIRQHIFAVDTQGGNRMRESCTYGSVRGARGNSRPYRDRPFAALHESAFGRYCCKSLFGLVIKFSFGYTRDFHVKMWGTSLS